MNPSFKLCKYPDNGYGDKSGMYYLLNQFGHIMEFVNEYDPILEERFWSIEIPIRGEFNGETVEDIVDQMRANGINIEKW